MNRYLSLTSAELPLLLELQWMKNAHQMNKTLCEPENGTILVIISRGRNVHHGEIFREGQYTYTSDDWMDYDRLKEHLERKYLEEYRV